MEDKKVYRQKYITVAPSLLSADFTRLRDEMKRFERTGAQILHLDVMDGNFVPNITFGYSLVEALRPLSGAIFDVHLMIRRPYDYIERFVAAGADRITIHTECEDDVNACLDKIHEAGLLAGVSINPTTAADAAFKYLGKADQVLIMTVYPGFGGQTMITENLDKILQIRDKAHELGLGEKLLIAVDGGINEETCCIAADKGANILIAGNAVFGARNMRRAYLKLTDKLQIQS